MADVILVGLGVTSLTALQSLSGSCRVLALVRSAQPGTDDAVLDLARDRNIPVFADTSITAIDALVERLAPACVVVSSYDRILPASTLRRTRFVNVHYSPLPRYRGRANVNWAILNGESHAAISIHVLEAGLDSGNLLFQEITPLGPDDIAGTVYQRLNDLQRLHLGATVIRHIEGDLGTPQPGVPTYGCTRLPRDGEIDWREATTRIDALIRALAAPFPGAFTYVEGQRLVVWRARPVENAPVYEGRIPGRVVGVSKRDGHVDVLTGDGVLRLFEVQPGETPVAAASVIRSVKATLGLTTTDLLARIHALEAELSQARSR